MNAMRSLSRWLPLLALGACAMAPQAPPYDLVASSGTLVARLVAPTYDAVHHAETCKPWHQLFAPDGRQISKDLGGEFEHHRGLFLGWNQVRCGSAKYDFWHCRQGETQRVRSVAAQPGPGAGQDCRIDWCAKDGTPVVHEVRRLSVRQLGAASCVHATHELLAADAPVVLDGDPQHSGAQFRAVQEFAAADAAKVTYVRPTTARAGNNDVWTTCRWIAAVLPFATGPVTVLRVEHADNPEATWSTRPYGRFGATWTATVTQQEPLRVRIAWIVQPGTADLATCEQLAAAAFDG